MQKVGSESKVQSFCQYFQVHKADQFPYHITKCVVQHTGIVDTIDLFTINATERVNSLLKSWGKEKAKSLQLCCII